MRPYKDTFVSNFCGTMAFNRIAVGAAKQGSVVTAGQLGNDSYNSKCSKHMFVLLCYSTDVNLFRLSKGISVRLDNSPLVEKGLLHEQGAEWGVIGSLERSLLRGCFKPSRCEWGDEMSTVWACGCRMKHTVICTVLVL